MEGMSEVVVGLDIGGTKLIAASADSHGRIIKRERALTPRALGAGLALVEEMIGTVSGGARIRAIGAAAGGPLNWETGVVSPLHQPEWRNIPLKSLMEAKYGCRFSVEVDTNLAALAEHHNAREKVPKLLYLTISTGMGGGFVVDGEIYRGLNGEHPEVGHQGVPCRSMAAQSAPCPCGSTGCLEALVSGSGIRRLYGKPPEELAPEEWEEVAWHLGQGLRNAAVIYSPDVVVVGGGVTFGAGRKLLAPAIGVMRDHLKIVPHPKVYASEMGEENVLAGAILLALRNGGRPAAAAESIRESRQAPEEGPRP
jgi:predicted NBD/HSP70 family sugar kinase